VLQDECLTPFYLSPTQKVELDLFAGLRMFLAVSFFLCGFPIRQLDSIVCSRPLVWLFSPAWDAVQLACQKTIIH
jgi:hypothetical protein